jgi:hypothetical protein
LAVPKTWRKLSVAGQSVRQYRKEAVSKPAGPGQNAMQSGFCPEATKNLKEFFNRRVNTSKFAL